MCLQDQGTEDNNDNVGRVRRARGLRKDNGGVGRERGIDDASEGLKKTTEAARARRQARVIYNNDGGFGGRRCSRRLKQQQWGRRRRVDDASKGLDTTTEEV